MRIYDQPHGEEHRDKRCDENEKADGELKLFFVDAELSLIVHEALPPSLTLPLKGGGERKKSNLSRVLCDDG